MITGGRSFSGRERNCAFLNVAKRHRGRRFANISAISGLDFPDDGRAIALCDWDHDGDVDVWISNRNAPRLRFLRNDTPRDNQSLWLRLVGQMCNRDAIGARVEVTLSKITSGLVKSGKDDGETDGSSDFTRVSPMLIKTVSAGAGFLSQSSRGMHFGLGMGNEIESVSVTWPGGLREVFAGCEPNQRYVLKQGSGLATPMDGPMRSLSLEHREIELPSESSVARIPIVHRVPMPSFEYLGNRGQSMRVQFGASKPVLLTFWSRTCRGCLAELKAFSEHEADLRAAELEILALSIDGLEQATDNASEADQVLSQFGFPFRSGGATRRGLKIIQTLQDFLISADRPLTLPVSFLVDRRGEIAVIYKGPLTIEQLLHDAHNDEKSFQRRVEQSALVPGRLPEMGYFDESARRFAAARRYEWAGVVESIVPPAELVLHYQRLLEVKPDFAAAHNDLGAALMRAGQLKEASSHFHHAIQSERGYLDAYKNLAAVHIQQQEHAAAEALLKQTLEMDPGYASAVAEMGMLRWLQGRKEAAARYFRRAIQMDPELDRSYYCLGIYHADRQEWTQAMQHLRTCLDLNPANMDAHQALEQIKVLQ